MTLPVSITGGVTTGHNAHHVALHERFNFGDDIPAINALDPAYGVVGDGSDESAGLIAAYGTAVATGKPLYLPVPPTSYGFAADLNWDSNEVSVLGAGSGLVTLQAIGTAKINIKPNPVSVVQAPKFGGFTLKGDPAAPPSAVGIYTGDIIGVHWDDLVVEGFTGTGSIGMWFDNYNLFTERNLFTRVWLNNNKISLVASHTGGGGVDGTNSFGYNRFLDLRINVFAGQTAFELRNDVNMYSSTLVMTCNVDSSGTVFNIKDTAQMNGVLFEVGAEQTAGIGGVGRVVSATAYVFGYGITRFEGGLTDTFTGGVRRTPAWRIMGPEAVIAGIDADIDGQMADFIGGGSAAKIHPLVWDSPQDPYATVGVMTGSGIRSPFVSMLDDAANAFVVYRVPFDSPFEDMAESFRITPHGGISTAAVVEPPTVANGAALGSGPPAAASSGNNTRGTVSLGTGASGVTTGVAATVTFLVPYTDTPEVTLTPLTAAAAAVQAFVASRSAADFVIGFGVAPSAAQSLGAYAFTFHVAG